MDTPNVRSGLLTMEAAKYSAIEHTRDGRKIEIRALRPEDRDDVRAAVGRTSDQSLYRRFFGAKREFSEKEVAFFMNVDFINHVALVAAVEEDGRSEIVARARYIREPPTTDHVAFGAVQQFEGQGNQ